MTLDCEIILALRETGYIFESGTKMASMLAIDPASTRWKEFRNSWNRLGIDAYMADGGRYRRRRHSVFSAQSGVLAREPHQAHFQGVEFNPLNGGIQRWFEPMESVVAEGAVLGSILSFVGDHVGALAPSARHWKIEVHQFRIEASDGEVGQPTPEGMHRDGVDFVLVMLVDRVNITSGTTHLADPTGKAIGSFTLMTPLDSVLLDDRRVFHGVTAVLPEDPTKPAWRDVLVVTFLSVD